MLKATYRVKRLNRRLIVVRFANLSCLTLKDLNFDSLLCLKPLTPNSGKHLIFPGSITLESNTKVILIKEMIGNSIRP